MIPHILSVALFAPLLLGQSASVQDLRRHSDGSVGGILIEKAGKTPFHLFVTELNCELWVGATARTDQLARRLVHDAAEERAVLRSLELATRPLFDARQLQLIREDEHCPGEQVSPGIPHHEEGWLLNRVMHYRRVHESIVHGIVTGTGTVKVSCKIRDGSDNEQVVLFRDCEGLDYPRIHLADAREPELLGSTEEHWILQALLAHLHRTVPATELDRLWADPTSETEYRAAARLLTALAPYLRATSPRVRDVLGAWDGGSIQLMLADERRRPVEILLDHAMESPTRGRIKALLPGEAERTVLAIGSEREARVLAMLDQIVAAAETRGMAWDMKDLAQRLELYRTTHHDKNK